MDDRERTDAEVRADTEASTDVDAEADTDADESALADAGGSLVVLALATFHTGLLVALLVAVLYRFGPLGELLDGLRTSLGLGLYLALWATTWWTNRRWLGVVADPEVDASASIVVGTGGKWGGVNGVAFFWAVFAVTFLPLAILERDVVPTLFVWAIGSLLALGIGGIVGALFAAFDLALFRVAARLGPELGGEAEDEEPRP